MIWSAVASGSADTALDRIVGLHSMLVVLLNRPKRCRATACHRTPKTCV
jgi:hypothetical protein